MTYDEQTSDRCELTAAQAVVDHIKKVQQAAPRPWTLAKAREATAPTPARTAPLRARPRSMEAQLDHISKTLAGLQSALAKLEARDLQGTRSELRKLEAAAPWERNFNYDA
jgi:phage terminase Nu1 subunit (DNA packaging protein)